LTKRFLNGTNILPLSSLPLHRSVSGSEWRRWTQPHFRRAVMVPCHRGVRSSPGGWWLRLRRRVFLTRRHAAVGYKYVLKTRFSYFFLVQLFILFILVTLKKVEFFHLQWRAHNIIYNHNLITEELIRQRKYIFQNLKPCFSRFMNYMNSLKET